MYSSYVIAASYPPRAPQPSTLEHRASCGSWSELNSAMHDFSLIFELAILTILVTDDAFELSEP